MSEAQKYLQNFDPNMDSDVPYDFLEGIFNETAEMQNNDDEISAFLDELMPCLDDQLSTSQNTLEHVPTVLEKYESYIITMVDTYKRVEASLSEHDLCCASTIECCKDFMARCVEFAENVRVFLEETFYPRFNLWQHQQLYPNIEPIESETLDQFEVWFNELYILLSSIRSQVKNTYAKHNSIWTDRGEYSLIQDKLLNNLVRKSCIFVEHPNQVLMKNSKLVIIILFVSKNRTIKLNLHFVFQISRNN